MTTTEVDESYVTVVVLEGGHRVRVSETLEEVTDRYNDPTGWIAVEDPGDARGKLIRAERVLWIEVEET